MRLVRFLPGALVLVPTLLFAQAQGRVKGVVTDAATGKRLAGAKVILTCPEISNFRRELVTDEKGGFATLIVDATKQYMFHVEAQEKILDQPGVKEAREGSELLDAGKVEEARAKFAQAVALKPDLYVAWLMQGDIDQKAGKNDDAIVAAEKCLAIKPEFPQCLALVMNAAQAKGDKATYEKYAERGDVPEQG
jgi:tetratricopeptide (TPR) repeat protein